jgi:hypothetical protein
MSSKSVLSMTLLHAESHGDPRPDPADASLLLMRAEVHFKLWLTERKAGQIFRTKTRPH